MRYISEYRDPTTVKPLIERIHREADPERVYRFMEFCGGHTHAISRFGLKGLLPDNIRLIHGPGCPVCVLPIGRIDMAITLARKSGVILCAYADTLRVPGSGGFSLNKARAEGAHIEMVYSAMDVLAIAARHPTKEVVFLAIGFETTTPPTAHLLLETRSRGISNLSVLSNHVLTIPAMKTVLEDPDPRHGIDGVIGPSHVSVIIGTIPYHPVAASSRKPIVITGFEPLDVLQAVLMLIRQVNKGTHIVENEYTRAVSEKGNPRALAAINETFFTRDVFEWRGLGLIPASGLAIADPFSFLDAERRFELDAPASRDHRACECASILRGKKAPQDCKVFGTACTPETPLGACMVSSEGACAAEYSYGTRERPKPHAEH